MNSTDRNAISPAFAHGFLAAADRVTSSHTQAWREIRVGLLHFYIHPYAAYSYRSSEAEDSQSAVLIGQAVDVNRATANRDWIVRRLLQTLARSGPDGATQYAMELGGRWALFIQSGSNLYVVNDSHAAQSVYWTQRGSRLVVGSHASLVADEAMSEVDNKLLESYSTIRTVRPSGTVYLPGVRTPFKGVRPIVANCRLEYDHRSSRCAHRRFTTDDSCITETANSKEEAYDAFEHFFDKHVKALRSLGTIAVSLTGGLDSATTLAAMRRHWRWGDFTFTYFNPNDRNTAATEDAFVASRRSYNAGVKHRLLKWRNPADDTEFGLAIKRTWPHARPSVGAAYAMYEDLGHDFYEFQSTVSETGTVFYRRRTNEFPDARRLTALWAGPRAAKRTDYVEAFEEFIEYAQFTPDALQGFDYHDMFYWEHRNTRWAAEKYQVGDFGHRVLLPFNARPIVRSMLSLPYELREKRWLLKQYVKRARERPLPFKRRVIRRLGH